MPPIRRSNRAPKPKVFWGPSITTPRRRQPPTFTIYTDAPDAPEALPGPETGPEAYRPQFLPEDRAGKPQNLPEETTPLKLFQLFFLVKEIENIVRQSNQRVAFIGFSPWEPLTIEEVYHYLGCLIYMGIQPLWELENYWALKTPIPRAVSQRRFKQIKATFTIRDTNSSPEQPGEPWWFRLEPLATTICQACQYYWAPVLRTADR